VSPEQIAEERRRGRLAGLAAVGAALSFAGGGFWYQAINGDSPSGNSPALLRFFDRHSGELIGASVLQSLGMVLLVFAALHLYNATKARYPKETGVVQVMAIYGPLAFAVSTVVRAIVISVSSADFVGRDFQTIDAADDIFQGPILIATTVLGFSGVIGLAYWLVKGCLDAMRTGILTRFLGVLGIAIGPALVLGFGTVVLPFWLLLLGALFLCLWPTGLPPAWDEGRAIPWVSSREAIQGALGEGIEAGRNGEVEAVGPGVRTPEAPAGPADEAEGGRRKRKRRR
jgi:hypothetical protein